MTMVHPRLPTARLALLLVATASMAGRASAEVPAHDGLQPREAAAAMTVPTGFHVELVAGEPTVHQPIAFTIDERGRLWVAEAFTYPARAPEGEGRDKIIILADSDGDGSFETRTVFAEGLNLVSGLEVGFGGVWVGAAPYLMFIPDRDRDDRPDGPPRILLDGFGYHDTHETLNSFLWGPDGWLYGCHGVFTHSNVGKPGAPDEERTPLNAGVWRYHPTRHEFEVFAHGTSNPWGVDFNDRGQAFVTACVIPHLFHVIQGARYQRQAGQHFDPYTFDDIQTIADHAHYAGNIRDHAWWGRDEPVAHADTDHAGGGHAHCGAMIYLGDNWPQRYRNTIFMTNIHGNRINNDVLTRRGSGYVGSHAPDFLLANDPWFRGINLKYGPDGGVYLIDWYDKNACHRGNSDIWDRTNGRIYKVTFGATQPAYVDLAGLDNEKLIALLLHKNEWHVRMARRVLQERAVVSDELAVPGRAPVKRPLVTPPVSLITTIQNHADIPVRLRALWAFHAISPIWQDLTLELLDATGPDSEYLRAWAIQLELEDRQVSEAVLSRLPDLAANDPSPIVRLYLSSCLQRLPLDQRWDIAAALLAHAEDAGDHNLPLMIWYGIEPLVLHDLDRALVLARQARIPVVARYIYRRAASDSKGLDGLLASLGEINDTAVQQSVLEEITGVVKNRGRLSMPKSWPGVYARLAESESADIRQRAQFITVKFGDQSIFPALRSIIADADSATDARRQALEALLAGEDKQLPPVLYNLLDDETLRGHALRGLARFDAPDTPQQILNRYDSLSTDEKSDAVSTLAARPIYALALLDAIEAGKLPRTDLPAHLVEQMRRFDDERVIERLNDVWGRIRTTPAEKLRLIAEWKAKLTPDVLAEADLPHGRALFKETCARCHRLFGDGGTIGPDITGSNRANLDYILENMIDPSAIVGRDYQMTVIATLDGRTVSGLIKEENESAVVVQTVNDVVVVPREDIDERTQSTVSLMPEGQLKQISDDDVRDLVAYLGASSQVLLPGAGPVFDELAGRVPGAIEGETLKVIERTAGEARSQKMAAFTKDRWSGADQIWWTGARPGDRLVLQLPVARAGRYELFAVMTKARDYGVVQFSLDGRPLGKPIDLYNAPDVITTGPVSLGLHDLDAGAHRLGVEIVGKHLQAAPGYLFGLDYVYLAPVAR